ncbi:MAG TPA: DUF2066 domain-containing protein [Aeromonadales bacterium]|nr:DUF2066 domain-containing protein [Aeromonadales bacterium]
MHRFLVGRLLFSTKVWVCLMLWLTPQQLIHAAELVDLFTVDVPVADRSASGRARAMRKGLEEVLIRASGINASATNEYLHSRLSKAQSFIQQYAYLKSEDKQNKMPWVLRINFEGESIHRLLSDAGVAIWGERRPVVMLWIAQQEGYQRQIITRDNDFAEQIEKVARRRAIPVQFPLLDLQDSAEVEITDVWGRFSSPIIKASRRYNATVILFGRVYQKIGSRRDDGWLADWQLILEGKRSGWKDSAKTTEEIYQHLFTKLGQHLCDKYCVTATQSADNEILVKVENLNTFLQAASAEKYLESLLPVRDVNLLQLKDNKALFLLRLVSREKSVLEAISLDSALSPLPSQPPVGQEKRTYNYRWTP